VLTGVPLDASATYKRIAKVDLRIPSKVSAEARDLIVNVRSWPGPTLFCLRFPQPFTPSPFRNFRTYDRALIGPFRCHPQLLQYDPEKRMPLLEVRRHPWVVRYRPKRSTPSSAGGQS
jgi:hypothetical protein